MQSGNRRHIRCRGCGRSVTYGLSVCPRCGRNPLRLHSRIRTTAWAVVLGVAAGIVLFPFAPAIGPAQAASPTPLVVAALLRPTFTATPSPTAPATPTPTLTPTSTSTPTPTSTTAARAATSAPVSTATATPTPRPTIEPPRPVSPPDQKDIGGEDAEIVLTWEGALQEGQQFAVSVQYIDRLSETKTYGSLQRVNRWRVPNIIFKDIHPSLRALKWSVTVIDAAGNPLSASSEPRIFIWHP